MRNPVFAVFAIGFGLILGCSTTRNDQTIATDIKASLFSDSQTKGANIDVAVKDGTVILTGDVPDENTRYEAFKLAKQTPGVVNVQDQMSLPAAPAAVAEQTTPEAESKKPDERKPARARRSEADSLPVRPLAGSSARSDRALSKNSPYGSAQQLQNASSQQASAPPPAPADDTSAPASTAAPAPAPTPVPAAPPAPVVRQVSIPSGTPVHIQMIDSVDSGTNHVGDLFHASLTSPIALNGESIVPTGTDVYVKLTNSKSAGRLTGRSELTLQLARLDFQGKSYALSSDDYQDVGKSRGKRTAEGAGIGAAVGAVLGGIFGGGKGAAIGAGAGGGAGTAGAASTGNTQVRIPSETKLDFTLQQPVDLTYSPDKDTSTR
jgi:hypothetical protein